MGYDTNPKNQCTITIGNIPQIYHISGQISIIPKPELRAFGGNSLTKPPFKVTSAEVVIICPDIYISASSLICLIPPQNMGPKSRNDSGPSQMLFTYDIYLPHMKTPLNLPKLL